jgi:hypothetical protein
MSLRLTAIGRQKLERVQVAVREALEITLAREVIAARAIAASFAPSPDEEAALLSRGVAQGGLFAGKIVGTPGDDSFVSKGSTRFMRLGTMLSLREAILTDPLATETTGARILVGTGASRRINARTGFFWRTRKRGVRGPSFPFNLAYVEAVENGGVYWRVVPRGPNTSLEPEPFVFTPEMIKTMKPFGMFRRARFQRAPAIRVAVGEAARGAARIASRA